VTTLVLNIAAKLSKGEGLGSEMEQIRNMKGGMAVVVPYIFVVNGEWKWYN